MRVNKRAQGMLEYAVLIAIIVAVIVGMQVYVKRALQGKFKQTADQMGEQFTTNQTYSIQTVSDSFRKETTIPRKDSGNWTESKILGKGAEGTFTVDEAAKGVEYEGYERTNTTYVTSDSKTANTLGTPSTFDSGKLKEKHLFDD